ncbi:MAG: copper chaperone PCu(A)C [Acidobacteria bacterium]|nr:copper chaperone PCu(A)C [Acidobacteriota bacterium]
MLAAAFALTGVPSASIAQTAPGVNVRQAWVREATAGQASTAAYFTIENHGSAPLTLVGVSSPVAATAELHTMQQTPGRGAMGNAPMGGMMRMAQVDRVVVPVHGTVEFKPGGYHVMLFKVTRALATGEDVELTLRFEGGETKTVVAVVGSRAAVAAPGQ